MGSLPILGNVLFLSDVERYGQFALASFLLCLNAIRGQQLQMFALMSDLLLSLSIRLACDGSMPALIFYLRLRPCFSSFSLVKFQGICQMRAAVQYPQIDNSFANI